MDIRNAYNQWAFQYDSNENKTRDLEAVALRECLLNIPFTTCLEIGCGTGKNTSFLSSLAEYVTAVDLSEEMLSVAKEKITADHVQFIQADITTPWHFARQPFDLITFSLVLEHIQHLSPIFSEASKYLKVGGHVYVGELHPFKQYTGSKARFETESGTHVVSCFTHHVSEFVKAGSMHGLKLMDLNEYFDTADQSTVPRILTLIFEKIA